MAVSSIVNDMAEGIQLATILNEGGPTVYENAIDETGAFVKTTIFASRIKNGDFVVINTDTGNTYAATGGLPVASVIEAGPLVVTSHKKTR